MRGLITIGKVKEDKDKMEWNILATAFMRRERPLLRLLSRYGDFTHSGYRDVVVGKVSDVNGFLAEIEALRRENPGKLRSLAQVVPIEKTFEFELSNFTEKLKEEISPYIERLKDKKFYVRVERRGHKGEISSQEVEKTIDTFILETLEKEGKKAKISFEEAENIIVVETLGNTAGVGLITKEMKEKYPLIKVK